MDLSSLDINNHSFLMHCTMLMSPCRDSDTTPQFLAVHFTSAHCFPSYYLNIQMMPSCTLLRAFLSLSPSLKR